MSLTKILGSMLAVLVPLAGALAATGEAEGAAADAKVISLLMFIQIGQITTTLIGVFAAIWAFQKWRIRDEHFPRLIFEVTVNFLGKKEGFLICEVIAKMENKGLVPIRFKDLSFVLRGLSDEDKVEFGGDDIRFQVVFGHVLYRGSFIPKSWVHSFIYPGVKTEYNYIAAIPTGIAFVRVQGDFVYMEHGGETHHAAKVLAVPAYPNTGDEGN